jgi:hypothetical protein
MNISIVPLVIGTLALAGASHAAAQSNPSDQSVSVGVATSRDSTAQRSCYKQKAHDEIRIWQQKLDDFDAEGTGQDNRGTDDGLERPGRRLDPNQDGSSRLETAGDADWNSAKISFRSESDKLAVAWHTVNPADK